MDDIENFPPVKFRATFTL